MGILFILSEILLITSFILRKKSEKEIDIIGFITISIVLLLCYNTFICYILTFFAIPIKLWILSIINLIFSIILNIPTIKKKEIQKYTFNKIDIIYISIITIILLAVVLINFGMPFDINYISSDPSLHFLTSIRFAKFDALMPGIEEPDPVYGSQSFRKMVSYVNSGLLMKCFCKDFNPIECYYVFASFEIFIFVLIGITMYSALKKYAKKKEHILWAFIIAIICALGYPLNSVLFGFEYLTMGLLIIIAIIDIVYYFDNDIFKLQYIFLMFGLLNFGLFCSYYMFVPFVYPALGIYFYIKNYQKTKKILTKEMVILWIITLIIPFILGYIYHLEPKMYAVFINKSLDIGSAIDYSAHIVNSGLAVDGFIYINVYSNMLLLLPLTIYLFIIDSKENRFKREAFLALISMFAILFIEILLIGNALGKVSMYYLSKNYFALWIILAFTNYKALVVISEKSKKISRLFISAYIVIMIICLIFSNVIIRESNKNEDENMLSVMEIFGANKTLLLHKAPEYNQKELDIINYAYNNLDFNSRIEVISDHRTYYWAYVLLNYTDKDELYNSEKYGGQNLLEQKFINLNKKIVNKNELDYVIYFNKSAKYYELQDEIFKNSQVVYQNEAGGILKYNK